jgi:hypothetical protein
MTTTITLKQSTIQDYWKPTIRDYERQWIDTTMQMKQMIEDCGGRDLFYLKGNFNKYYRLENKQKGLTDKIRSLPPRKFSPIRVRPSPPGKDLKIMF